MFEITEFDVDSLAHMTREQAALGGSLGKAAGGLAALGPAIAMVIERYSSAKVKLRVVMPVSTSDMLIDTAGAGFEGVAASIRCIDPPARVMVLMPGTVCETLARCVLSADTVVSWSSPEQREAVVLHLISDVIRSMPRALPVMRLESLTTLGADDAQALAGPLAVVYVKVRIGGHNDIVTLLASPEHLHALAEAPWLNRLRAPGAAAMLIEATVAVVLGTTTLTTGSMAQLAIGDVVTIDHHCETLGAAGVVTGTRVELASVGGDEVHRLGAGRITDDRFIAGPGGPAMLEATMPDDAEHTTVDATAVDSAEAGAVARVPTQVVVEAGRVQMKVGDLLGLSEGTVIALEKPASGQVTLSVSGRPVAHGVLVVVDGELGVKVLGVHEVR